MQDSAHIWAHAVMTSVPYFCMYFSYVFTAALRTWKKPDDLMLVGHVVPEQKTPLGSEFAQDGRDATRRIYGTGQ